MIIQSPAAVRLPRRALPLAAALLLASLPLLASQEFSRPSDSSDFSPPAAEVSVNTYEAPSEPPSPPSEPSVSSEPSAPAESSVPSEASGSSVPSESGGSVEPSAEELAPAIRLAQERSRPSDSSDAGRTAHEIGSHGSSSSDSGSRSASGGSSSSSDSGRTARPVGPGDNEPHRQPPSRGSRDHHGGHHGGGYYPGYYGPYGYWPGFWWWGGWWDYSYYPYGYGQPRYYGRGDVGALDFDVSPARTEIYLDGQYVGKVDAFDGWPRYLWLPKGTYDVVLYLDGFRTIARQITVYPGSVIDIDDRMEPGDSVRPEDLASKSHERRDERLQYERERRERLERGEPGDDEGDWRDRVRRERGYRPDDRYDDDDDEEAEEISEQKGRLRLEVEPEDASVYLDGRFVGTGSELALMRGGLPVAPGEHKLAVVRPGRKAEERDFQVEAGEEVELEVNLETDSR